MYPNGNTPRWYRRSANLEDPWVSLKDHENKPSMMLYGENNASGYLEAIQNNGGARVYIRNAPTDME